MSATNSILIVDDDPDIHRLLAAALAGGNYSMEDKYDGLQALSLFQTKPFDLVITDIRMPGMDGLELSRRIRALRPATRVLVMTAESTPATVISALRDEALGYFSKPFSLDAVVDMVARALSAPASRGDIEVLSAIPQWISLQLRCKLDVADRLISFVREIGTDLSAEEREDVGAAFRELLMNAIEHGGQSDPRKTVRIDYIRTAKSMIYKIWDPGEGFSFDELPHAAVSNSPDAPCQHVEVREKLGLRPGGFGILLTRKLADELIYNQKGNEVLLIKYVSKPEGGGSH
ncbi:MAG: response regulator [Acidobacteriaceae bacterium]|nr:response regulator [Acidobacteriaceae bacterium]MBV9502566.1 response regulator [Acidobacteriaceae bacterium]